MGGTLLTRGIVPVFGFGAQTQTNILSVVPLSGFGVESQNNVLSVVPVSGFGVALFVNGDVAQHAALCPKLFSSWLHTLFLDARVLDV